MNNITIIVSIVLFSYLVSFIVGKIVVELLTKNNINQRLSIYLEETMDNNKYGITVPKKIGKAHIRNKLKRQIKNIIR